MDAVQVRTLAEQEYGDEFTGMTPDSSMFALLVDVADAYVKELELQASDDPAPFLAGATPIECALLGLRENLEMIRERHLWHREPDDDEPDTDPDA